jgi:biopolymer transport protein ExbD
MLSPKTRNFGSIGTGQHSASRERRPENVVPMINIVFLLLLYFMVAGNLHIDLEVTPPDSIASVSPSSDVLEIAITVDGKVRYRGNTIAIAQIENELSGVFKDQVVQISADAQTDVVLVAQTVGALSKVGIERATLLTLKKR